MCGENCNQRSVNLPGPIRTAQDNLELTTGCYPDVFWIIKFQAISVTLLSLIDHKVIYISISLSLDQSSGPEASFWKLNSSLPEHEQVKLQIKEMINTFWSRAKSQSSYGRNWELLKYEIGKFLRKFGGDQAKEKRAVEDDVIVQLASLSQQEDLSNEESIINFKIS